MLARLFAILLLLVTPMAAAAPGPAPTDLPQLDRYVYAELALAQPNLTTLVLTGELWAYRYDVSGKVYDADEIGQAFHTQNKYLGEPSGAAFIVSLETNVRTALGSTLRDSFPDATISGITATVDRAALATPNGNPYDPPVHTTVTATIVRTPQSVGLGTLSNDAIAAAFASGARVSADFTLAAQQGYHILYAISAPAAPASLRWESASGVATNGEILTIAVDNTAGDRPTVSASGRLYDAAVTPPTEEDIRSTIDVAMGEIQLGTKGIPIRVSVDSEVRSLEVARRFPNALPAKVSLPFVNADGVRALRVTGAIDAAALAAADQALLDQVRSDVERAFGPGATVNGGLDLADLVAPPTPYSADDPLHFLANSTTTYEVAGADADDIDLALRVGGKADVDVKLFAANGRATTFAIHPPSIGEFTNAEGGTVAANGLTANFQVPAGSAAYTATVAMRGRGVPDFSEEKAVINVLVDIADVDAGVGKVVGGDMGTLLIDITVVGDLNVIRVPDDLKGSLPAKLQLEYLSADSIRLLVDRGYISAEDLAKLEKTLGDQVREKLGAALGGSVPVESGLDRASLAAALVSTPISGDEPVKFRASATVRKPLAGGALEPQAALALYTRELPLTLPRIQGLETVYTIVAPRGLAFTSADATGGDAERTTREDGRDQIVVRPTEDSATLTAGIAVTPTFVMMKFWPIVLLAVILLVLIVGTPIALVMRKRAKVAGKK